MKDSSLDLDIQTTTEYSREYSREYTDAKTGKVIKNPICTGYYIVPEIEDNDLRYLIDSVLCAKHLTTGQKKRIIEALKNLTYDEFSSRAKYIETLSDVTPNNSQFFNNIEKIGIAIEEHRKISFQYYRFGTDKQLHVKTDRKGNPITYIVNPVQIVMANGWYYLIGNPDKYDDLSGFRLDKIRHLSILEEAAKPNVRIKGAEQIVNPVKYIQDHVFMFSSAPEVVRFRAGKEILDEIMDRFGGSASFLNETEKDVEVRVTTDPAAMRYWALQYARHVRILFPPALADQIKSDLLAALDNYT